jgi:hypothetical protein
MARFRAMAECGDGLAMRQRLAMRHHRPGLRYRARKTRDSSIRATGASPP